MAIDHIPEQNRVVGEFSKLVSQRDMLLSSNQLTIAWLEGAIQQIQQLVSGFKSYTNGIGTARALQGYNDVSALGDQIIAGFRANESTIAAQSGQSFAFLNSGGITGGAAQACIAGVCGPSQVTSTGVQTGGVGPIGTQLTGGSGVVYSGGSQVIGQPSTLPNNLSNVSPNPFADLAAPQTTTASIVGDTGGKFDLVSFAKSPMGLASIGLIVLVLVLASKKGG